ncbi:hypothetical protein [Iodobacter fluviatilis]
MSINGQKINDLACHMGMVDYCFSRYTLLNAVKNYCLIIWR